MWLKILKRGAEADICLATWNDTKVIIKTRTPKSYRNSLLDLKIRKQRTLKESQIMSEVKSFGIPSPVVYCVNVKKAEIVMQEIPGTPIHDLDESQIILLSKIIGRLVGIMHKNGIMHGDLTTSNFILFNNTVYTIDFGLSHKTIKPEDHAVDLRLIKEILNSAHAPIMNPCWQNFLSGYKSMIGPSRFARITSIVSEIESRGRYATVV